MISRLRIERDCEMVRRHILGMLGVLEHLEIKMASTEVVSSTELLYLHFDKNAEMIRKVLDSPEHIAKFAQMFPGQQDLLTEHGPALCDALDELHAVRMALILPYADKQRKYTQRDQLEMNHPLEDRAAFRGLTPTQQAIYESQLDSKGFIVLSETDKARFLDAIRSHLEP